MKRIIIMLTFIIAMASSFIVVRAGNVANLSGYGVATSDTYQDQGTIALAAVDGDILDASRWVSSVNVSLDEETGLYRNRSGRTSWLQIEFEIETEISSAKIFWAREKAAEGHYKLLYSNDGDNWTETANFSINRNDGDGSVINPCIDTIKFDAVKAVYYRVEISAGETPDGLGSIYEFELYGDKSQYDFLKKENNLKETITETESIWGTKTIITIVIGVCAVAVIILLTNIVSKKIKGSI